MKTSTDGVARICAREGFVPHPYNDPPGSARWSHGFGTECAKNSPSITREQAQSEMAAHLVHDEVWVSNLVTWPLTQAQFDALVSFVYNAGAGSLERSSVLSRLNAGDVHGAGDALLAWDKVMQRGELVPSSALLARRQDERAQFLSDQPTDPPPAERPTSPDIAAEVQANLEQAMNATDPHDDTPPDDTALT